MERLVVASAVLLALVWLGVPILEACGAKFLVTQKSGRLAAGTQASPMNVLVYQHDPAVAEISRRLEATLEKAGHTVTVAATVTALRDAMDSDGFGLVLIHLDEAPALRDDVESRAPEASILPWVEFASPVERSIADDQFGHLLVLKARRQEILATIEASARGN